MRFTHGLTEAFARISKKAKRVMEFPGIDTKRLNLSSSAKTYPCWGIAISSSRSSAADDHTPSGGAVLFRAPVEAAIHVFTAAFSTPASIRSGLVQPPPRATARRILARCYSYDRFRFRLLQFITAA
jgi:hypothetical protein